MLEKVIKQIKEAQKPIILDLDDSYIDDECVKLLAEAIKEAKFPVSLFLASTNITTDGFRALAETMKQVQNEFSLCLVGNDTGPEVVSLLAEGIQEAKVPVNLNLGDTNAGDECAKLLGEAMKVVRLPLNLCLSSNNIREAGASYLADGIKQAKGTLNIELSENHVGNAGAKFFAVAIVEKVVPLDLCLSDNLIGKDGIEHIVAAVERAESPITLDVSGNNIEDDSVALLAHAIKSARTPFALDWSVGDISAAGKKLLDDAIADNFVVDARKKPSKFLARTGFNLCRKMLEHGLRYASVISMIITGYISDDDLAWTEVSAIRAVEGASYNNKYSSINPELLNLAYFNTTAEDPRLRGMIPVSRVAGCNKQKEEDGNLTSSASSACATDNEENKNFNDGGSEESNLSSCSSSTSSSSYESHSGYDGGTQPAKLSSQQYVIDNYLSNDVKAINYRNEQTLHSNHGKCYATETLLMTFFTWIKDLSKPLQQQVLSSFSVQQILEALEKVMHPNKFIDDQLSDKQVGETFATEYKSYCEQYDLASSSTKYAQINQQNSSAAVDAPTEITSSGEVQKYDIGFGASLLLSA